jgi:hypothetical protein
MSIVTQCDQFTATLMRQVSVVGNEGGVKLSWSIAPRTAAGLPTSIRAEFQEADAEDKRAHGILAERIAYWMFTASDPKVSTEDLVVWTDNSGIVRSCEVTEPSTDTRGRIWDTLVEWDKTMQSRQ